PTPKPNRSGTITQASTYSAALNGPIDYEIYLPAGYERSTARYPTLYLLHGRGDSMTAWTQEKADLDRLISTGKIPPVVVVMPDAPWADRGSWYVDSQYTGADYPGLPVETALTRDLVQHVDRTYRTVNGRWARAIGGYSMGGAGALRYVLAHQDLFGAALILSPAVYNPLPPSDSSVRDYGAFGVGEQRFVDARYEQLNYTALLPQVNPDLPIHLYLAVGDKEYVNPDPADATHDLDFEEAVVYNKLVRTPGITADWRVLGGGHDWDVWQPGFVDGAQNIFGYIGPDKPEVMNTPLIGTAGNDWAGGVAPSSDGSGDVTVGLAASGPVDGQPYQGKLDAVVTRRSSTGTTRWTTEFGTPADERLYGTVAGPDGSTVVAGYTNGNLDGAHPANTAGDLVAASVGADGARQWTRQLGDATAADRAYALAPDGTGGSYLAGYTKGSVGGTANAGDKDALLVHLDRFGNPLWTREFGGPGEDKALTVTASTDSVYVAGVTSATMPGGTAAGGSDGWIAAFAANGTQRWVHQVGSSGDDLLAGAAMAPSGDLLVTGTTGADALVIALSPSGQTRWQRQFGTADDDAGVGISAAADGTITVVGYTDGRFTARVGAHDVFAATLTARGAVQATRQFGTAADDGVDPFAESNLYLTGGWTTGVTYGNAATRNHGGADVFVNSLA
ncbi:MAG TPA: alpha/beta hydrolase-fold protein, partial [Jatrophihabitantaceae bacterium]|nr:alpha/beta hydrolase-fold protein [Jatrophihabitantaceae bacterium]